MFLNRFVLLYAKAEAEADPALLYGAYGYAGYAAPYTYGYAGYPYAYSTLAGYGTTNGANTVGSPESPQLPPPLLPEDTPLPEDTSPTLPELSMLPRLRLMLMLTTDTTDMPGLMLTVLDTEATDTDTHMLTTERDLLMLSQRPRLMPLSSTEPMDMLVFHTLDTPMVLTHMPTELTHMLMELTTKRSADAEPEADAYYGYYGYARPYSYGYAPYAYGAYPYGYGYAWGK